MKSKVIKMFVIGEAKSGKSSLINELIGMDLLPTSILQCTNSFIELSYADEYEMQLTLLDESIVSMQGLHAIKTTVQSIAAIDEKYRGLPVHMLQQFIFERRGTYTEEEVLHFIDKLLVHNFLHFPREEYEQKIRKFLDVHNNHWNKFVSKIKINGPFPNKLTEKVHFVDTPGIGAAGDLGNIAYQQLEEADIIMFVKSITGTALESTAFKKILEKVTAKKQYKEKLFVLTRAANLEKGKIEHMIQQAHKIYPQFKPEHIIAVDNKAQYYKRKLEDTSYEEIRQTILNGLANGTIDNFIAANFLLTNDKKQLITNLEKTANFIALKKILHLMNVKKGKRK